MGGDTSAWIIQGEAGGQLVRLAGGSVAKKISASRKHHPWTFVCQCLYTYTVRSQRPP